VNSKVLVLDTSPLVILIVGSVEPQLLGKTAHLKAYTPEDYELVAGLISRFRVIAVTPHVLTEVAHFVTKIGDSHGPLIRARFVEVVSALRERPIPTKQVVARIEFAWLDLADCSLLQASGRHDILLSTDAKLVKQRLEQNLPALNLNQLRERAGIL
jgi:predicted nucleic acid-binding protein